MEKPADETPKEPQKIVTYESELRYTLTLNDQECSLNFDLTASNELVGLMVAKQTVTFAKGNIETNIKALPKGKKQDLLYRQLVDLKKCESTLNFMCESYIMDIERRKNFKAELSTMSAEEIQAGIGAVPIEGEVTTEKVNEIMEKFNANPLSFEKKNLNNITDEKGDKV